MVKEDPEGNIERLGNLLHIYQTDIALPALDAPDVRAVQLALMR